MAYPPYDAFNRQSISRRQSLAYGATPIGYPYRDQHQGMYQDPMMPPLVGGDVSDLFIIPRHSHLLPCQYPQPSYQIYGPPTGTVPLNHRLTGPCKSTEFHPSFSLHATDLSPSLR